MSIKKTVYIDDYSEQFIRDRARDVDDKISWSSAFNKYTRDLSSLIRDCMPGLALNEWQMLLNVYTGHFNDQHISPMRIASDIMDCYGVVDINDLADDHRALVKKCHGMSQCQQYAVLDVVQRYWSKDRSGDFGEIMRGLTE